MARWKRWDALLGRGELWLIAISLSLMIAVAFAQIILRNALATGLSWGDALVRYLVLWIGFIGAAAATREGKHIHIDVFFQRLSGRLKKAVEVGADLISAITCVLLTIAAVKFTRVEALMGGHVFGTVASWIPQIIMPAVFALMAVRFFMHALSAMSRPEDSNQYDLKKGAP
jgi:TRAP-type C4-dicarboxylate transport system permease small subunit